MTRIRSSQRILSSCPSGASCRPFGTAWFIVEFLKGRAPAGSPAIDPAIGASLTDVYLEYKSALQRAHAQKVVAGEEVVRLERGLPPNSVGERRAWLAAAVSGVPSSLTKVRPSSFRKYVGHLRRLGWVEETEAGIRHEVRGAPSPVACRLTQKGWDAAPGDLADPIRALYQYSRKQRSPERHHYYRASQHCLQPEVR